MKPGPEHDPDVDAFISAFVAGMHARGRSVAETWIPWLAERWRRVGKRWPGIVRPQAFAAALSKQIEPGEDPATIDAGLQLDDLALASACAQGDANAIAALEHAYARHLEQVIAGVTDPRLGEDDKWQIVRLHLFVATADRGPTIAHYSGRGSFAAWLRVTAKRVLLNAIRRHEPARVDTPDDAIIDAMAAAAPDAELQLLGSGYREAFRGAFRRALSELDARDRGLLREVALAGLSVRDLGRVHGVHHATAARWLRQVYDGLLLRIKLHLARDLGSDERGVESVLSLIRSRLDASFADLDAVDPS